jgi:hypothetical protein
MEVKGNLEGMKKNLAKTFEKKLSDLDIQFKKESELLKKDFQKEIDRIRTENQSRLDKETKALRHKLTSEKNRQIGLIKTTKRQELINSVIDSIIKDAKEIIKSKDYIDIVKKSLPIDAKIYGDKTYEKTFGKVNEDKSINGIRAEKENIIYDFTIESMIDSKNDAIKDVIAQELFK